MHKMAIREFVMQYTEMTAQSDDPYLQLLFFFFFPMNT